MQPCGVSTGVPTDAQVGEYTYVIDSTAPGGPGARGPGDAEVPRSFPLKGFSYFRIWLLLLFRSGFGLERFKRTRAETLYIITDAKITTPSEPSQESTPKPSHNRAKLESLAA